MTTDALQQAVQFIQAGDLDGAEATLRALLQNGSGDGRAFCLLGRLRQARGRPDEALGLFQEAARRDPHDADAYTLMGAALAQLGHLPQAQACAEEALRLNAFHPEAYNLLGKLHLMNRRPDDAISCFQEAIRLHPTGVDALNSLALALVSRRQFAEARPLLERVVQLAPQFAGGLSSLAALYFEQGEWNAAADAARRAVALDPRQPAALDLLGAALLKLGRADEAVPHLRAAVEADPNFAPAQEHLGIALADLGRRDEAAAALRRAMELNPGNLRVLSNLAALHREQGQWREVVEASTRLLGAEPNSPDALHTLGLALLSLRQPTQALPYLEQAVQLRPDFPEALCSLGWACNDLGNYARSEQVLKQALLLQPDFVEALHNLALAYNQTGRPEDAAATYERAVRIRPEFALGWGGLGNVYKDLGLHEKAIAAYRRCVTLNPRDTGSWSNMLLSLHYVADVTPEEIYQEHLAWARHNAVPPAEPRPHPNDRDPERRLRLGYVSGDYRTHVMGWYLDLILHARDRGRFEVFCYSNERFTDDTTARLRAAADHWRDIHSLPDDDVEEMIRRDGIDILMDFNGHTGANRLPLFARKPAPVQASHFGYMDTSGVPAIDYRLTDAVCDPPGRTERWHTERLVRLPEILWCYRANVDVPVNALPADAAGHLTLGMFGAFPKITAPAVAAWAEVLRRLPGSRLVLLAGITPRADQRLRDEFARHGIDPARLDLEGKRSRPDYFRLYQRADLVLDSFPYAGCNTTCDSLWMGVPVVTLAGQTCMSRQGASPLAHLGLHDLITETPRQYVETAVRLAGDLPRLRELRATLRGRMEQSTLMNPERFTRQLEEAYRWMWRQWASGTR